MSRREQYLAALGVDLWRARASAATVAAASPATPVAPVAPIAPVPTVATTPPVAAIEAAEPVWQALRAEVSVCTRCALASTRTQTVFGVGDQNAELLIVGEAPGADEDRQGEPFVGRAGQLLNSMLRAIGTAREHVYIANVLKCRPPGNRDPRPDEVAACMPYLQRQVELLQPKLILALGRIAAHNLLSTDAPLTRLRGRVHRFGAGARPLIVTYHPAYLLRSPVEKRKAWIDLKFVRAELARSGAPLRAAVG